MRFVRPWLLLMPFALVLITGCPGPSEGPTAAVTGKVYVGDTALNTGQVSFTTEDLKSSGIGTIGSDGAYTVKAPIGKCKVSVIAPPAAAPGVKSPMEKTGAPANVNVPARYSAATTSDIVYEVKEGQQTHDVKLPAK
jgi:hypothetical protein